MVRENAVSDGKRGARSPGLPARCVLPRGSWRDASVYAPLGACGPRGLAWELLRRDPAYCDAAHAGMARCAGAWPLVAAPGLAERWGLHLLDDPARSACDAQLFWTPAADPSVLTASMIEGLGWLRSLGVDHVTVETAGTGRTRQALAVGGLFEGVRIDVRERDCGDARLLGFDLALTPALPVQLAELDRLWRLWRGEAFLPTGFARGMERSLLALRTIDALAEGASLRTIGEGLIFADDWPGDSEWVKSRARRIIAAARAMWAGGPLAMLSATGPGLCGPVSKRGAAGATRAPRGEQR